MSHTATITRSTTTSSGTPLFANTNYLRTLPGRLKIVQLLLGAVCVGVVGSKLDSFYSRFYGQKPEILFLIVSVTFLIGTFCLLLSYITSDSTASMISKTLFEVIYHGLAFIFYLAAALTLIIKINTQKNIYRRAFSSYLAASVMGLVNAGLYLYSALLAHRTYRVRPLHTSGEE